MNGSTLADSLTASMASGIHCYVWVNPKNRSEKQIRSLSLLSRLWHYRDTRFHHERQLRIAEVFTQCLHELPRLSPMRADRVPLVISARKWLKIHHSYFSLQEKIIETFTKELLATRLGIHTEELDHNEGFERFARETVLSNYLIRYQHTLKVNEQNKIFILHENEYKPWDTVKEIVCKPPSLNLPNQPWVYGQEGIQDKDLYHWTKLEPFMKGNPQNWGNQYGIEYCTCCIAHPRLTGDHTWIRLYTPEGDIYSHGLYLPGKSQKQNFYHAPFRIKRGMAQSPDVSEFWNVPIQALFIGITAEHFLAIKKAIEEKKQIDEEIFHLFESNCTMDANKLGALADIHLPTEAPILYVYASAPLRRFYRFCSSKLPLFVQKIFLYASAILGNCIQVLFGASKVDKRVQEFKKIYPAHISSWKDIFNIRKMNIHSPFYLATEVNAQVMAWRQKKLSKAKTVEKEFKIKYGLPKRFR